jgi:hypothetical protein
MRGGGVCEFGRVCWGVPLHELGVAKQWHKFRVDRAFVDHEYHKRKDNFQSGSQARFLCAGAFLVYERGVLLYGPCGL